MLVTTFDTVLGSPLDATTTLRHTIAEGNMWGGNAELLNISTSKYMRFNLASAETQRRLSNLLERQNRCAEFATILRALGKSRIANNLNQLAYSANIGDLTFENPAVVAQINEAYEAIIYIRALLIKQSGIVAL